MFALPSKADIGTGLPQLRHAEISQSEKVDPLASVVSIRVSIATAGTCGTAHRAPPLLICAGAVKHPRDAPATGRL